MKRAVPIPACPKESPAPPGGAFAFRVPVDRRQRMGESVPLLGRTFRIERGRIMRPLTGTNLYVIKKQPRQEPA
jgi:hypothetical protein